MNAAPLMRNNVLHLMKPVILTSVQPGIITMFHIKHCRPTNRKCII